MLATLAAVSYGLSDFIGGLLSRRLAPWSVAVVAQVSSVVVTAALAAFVAGRPTATDFVWAAFAGIGSGVGTGFLFRGLAGGRMGVVAPVSAVGAAIVPVLAGLLAGERPDLPVWLGILVAFPAIWLVASEPPSHLGHQPAASGAVDGVLAGLGFGLMFAALGQLPDSAGMWPLALTQVCAVLSAVVLAVVLRTDWIPRTRATWWALCSGPLGASATILFLLAAQRGYLTVTGVIASLYPAATIVLAASILRERVHLRQGLGLLLCGAAVTLVAVG
ncbi:MAG: DMT family transporter [Nocardioidaceae bacterium]